MTSQSQDARAWQRPDDPARPSTASLVDPEDDLPSASYGGDFETTAIPRWDANKGAPAQPVYPLLNDPEPLPYVQPGNGHPMGHYGADPAEVGYDPFAEDRLKAAGRRGTQDLGLMLLRVGLGILLIAHGLRQAFGLWGGSGLTNLQDTLTEAGYQYAGLVTYVAAFGQIGAGLLLLLGLFTPAAAAVALAYLINELLATMSAEGNGFAFFLPGGREFQVTLIVVTVAIILTGPGRYGFDAGRGWARRPFVGSVVALLLGIGLGVGVWVLLNGANPLA
ncbi:hypothetical protein A5757_07585 [Mycobacterium sp. 852013-51886_SCH5428379]|uniref:DoxX family protein n=1 Tax=Mycobacterium sp. 852013-51886_SCH5428379 TaxID=1834111 RepID=UPI00080143FA|nr:DoxX family protein [Mycobacterium sp. 852013-51886_SCH5428379]OBB61354.1 hypothetical protein A5757_07585 [Mycobacterium sp. 852013-51886_SCH5428379]